MKKTLAAFLFLLATCRLVSQTEASVTMVTVNDGLSQGMIFDIIQSRDGFIWIATKDGLNRYDGTRFEVFSPDPFNPFAIGSSEVHKLFEDSRGWIWVVFPAGLDVFDQRRLRGYTAFMVDKSGMVWVGTSGFGIAKINEKGQKFKTALPGTGHRLLYEGPNGVLYSPAILDKKFLSKSFDRSAPNTDLPLLNFRTNIVLSMCGAQLFLSNSLSNTQ